MQLKYSSKPILLKKNLFIFIAHILSILNKVLEIAATTLSTKFAVEFMEKQLR